MPDKIRFGEVKALAEGFGFHARVLDPHKVPVCEDYRKYCEENLCGNFGKNYSCPPACGSITALHEELLKYSAVIALETAEEKENFDTAFALDAGKRHNKAVMALTAALRDAGYDTFGMGCGGCFLCERCAIEDDLPCLYPEKRLGCISAFGIDAGGLMELCGFEFGWSRDKLYLVGMTAIK